MTDAPFNQVDVSSWHVRDAETAGDDEKVWLTAPDGRDWLFKPITEHKRLGFIQGEDWSEKVSSEISALLGVPCAKVELAIRKGTAGFNFIGSQATWLAATARVGPLGRYGAGLYPEGPNAPRTLIGEHPGRPRGIRPSTGSRRGHGL
jgi:hypothetical protein